jgi:hypothetical protein
MVLSMLLSILRISGNGVSRMIRSFSWYSDARLRCLPFYVSIEHLILDVVVAVCANSQS